MDINNLKIEEKMMMAQVLKTVAKSTLKDSNSGFEMMLDAAIDSYLGEDKDFKNIQNQVKSRIQTIVPSGEENKYLSAYNNITDELKSNNVEIETAIKNASLKYGVDEKLIRSVIHNESRFQPNVTSCVGAIGLMQVMPENFNYYGVKNPYGVNENVDTGTRILKQFLDMYGGNKELALAAYGGGPTRLNNVGKDINKMPEETRNAVRNVMKYYRGV